MTKTDRIKLDPTTLQWMITTLTAETTLVCCDRCGLYYKSSLGHKCKEDDKDETR